MGNNLNVVLGKGKGKKQEVQGVTVFKKNNEFIFNYNTALDPQPDEIELLKVFRNRFIDELEKLNIALGHIPK